MLAGLVVDGQPFFFLGRLFQAFFAFNTGDIVGGCLVQEFLLRRRQRHSFRQVICAHDFGQVFS